MLMIRQVGRGPASRDVQGMCVRGRVYTNANGRKSRIQKRGKGEMVAQDPKKKRIRKKVKWNLSWTGEKRCWEIAE